MHRLRALPAPALLSLMYVALIAAGGALLWLPMSHTGAVGGMQALFTAASAVTVTGLVVVDTGSDLTLIGQAIVMVLIQLGGLGLMVFAVMLLSALGISMGLSMRVILRQDLRQNTLHNLPGLARQVLKIATVIELIGAGLLMFVFVPEFGWAMGTWNAVFHSVSAFNNAGFALFPDSLSRWATDPLINAVIPLMFILSGLGFIVIGDILTVRRWHSLSLHSKLMIVGTAALIVWGCVSFAILEWTNPATLGAFDHW